MIKKAILLILLSISAYMCFWCFTCDVDQDYGRFPIILFTSFPLIAIWSPYWIMSMFIDENKKIGTISLLIVIVNLIVFGSMLLTGTDLGEGFIAFSFLALSLIALSILSVISYIIKRKNKS